jgi:hypothetical protein
MNRNFIKELMIFLCIVQTTGNDIQGQVTNDLNMMESPDESQVTLNPYIFSLEQSVSELSFCDSR